MGCHLQTCKVWANRLLSLAARQAYFVQFAHVHVQLADQMNTYIAPNTRQAVWFQGDVHETT